jgi:hypothetical protein
MIPVPSCPFNDPVATREGLIEPREKAKNLERGFFGFIHRNHLKSHETGKGLFGNPWRNSPKFGNAWKKAWRLAVARKPTIPCRAA